MLWQVNVTLYIDRIHFPSSLIIEVSISSHYSSLRAHRVRSLSPEQWPLPPHTHTDVGTASRRFTHHFTVRVLAEPRSELDGPHEHEE